MNKQATKEKQGSKKAMKEKKVKASESVQKMFQALFAREKSRHDQQLFDYLTAQGKGEDESYEVLRQYVLLNPPPRPG